MQWRGLISGAIAGWIGGIAGGVVASASDSAADDGFGIKLGGIVAVAPVYEGSTRYRLLGAPFLAPSFGASGRSFVDVRGPDDVRFRLFEHAGFEAGPLAGWRFGRDQTDDPLLRGLGDVEGGVVAGAFAAYRIGVLKPFVSYHHQLSGSETGGALRFGSEAIWQIGSTAEIVGLAGTTWADDDYMSSYFSITPLQAAASATGLPRYTAGAGIKDVYLGVSANVPLTDK
ncbi:MAG: MipA/OmpV family protein, partial [Hyphomicrobiaceae bacterium]